MSTDNNTTGNTPITLTREQFRSLASLATLTSSNDVAAVLSVIKVTITAGQLEAVATDRYRLGRVQFPVTAEDTEFKLEAKTLKAFIATAKKHAGDVTLVVEDDGVLVAAGGSQILIGDSSRGGTFPPVERLITNWAEATTPGVPELGLDLGFLADIKNVYAPSDPWKIDPHRGLQFKFATGENGKPCPVLITDDYGTLDILIQPKMKLR